MGKRFLYIAFVLAVAGTWLVTGCKKDKTPSEPLEAISLVEPDTTAYQQFAGDTVPIQIKFTTSKPINFVQCLYDMGDTTGISNYQPSYPDTLFNITLVSDTPRLNIYTATSVYRIPDSLPPFSVIHFKAFFTAGNSSFMVGQNYPAGVDSSSKTFVVNVR